MDFRGKHALLKRLMSDHACASFVETGTYEAKMSMAMTSVTQDVRTIELSEKLHDEARVQVKNAQKESVITLILGNSADKLPEALEGALKPLVWLDAHWSAGKTVRDDSGGDTPIVKELNALKEWGGEAVVAINDIRCFDGANGYPTVKELKGLIEELWPGATTTREDDVLWFVTPP